MTELEIALQTPGLDMGLLKKSIAIGKATNEMKSDFYKVKWGDLEKRIADKIKEIHPDTPVYGKGGERL